MARAALDRRPAMAVLAQAAGDRLPSYVTREQARAIINAAATTTHRLLLEALWQSGGRVTEVLRLRPCDLDPGAPVLHLVNLKQRPQRGGHLPRKAVIVSPDLVAALRALTNDAHVAHTGYFFRSRKSQGRPMSYGHCWRLIRRYAIAAGVQVVDSDGAVRPATGRDFRHGAAVNQVRQGVPLSEVQQQLGHARSTWEVIAYEPSRSLALRGLDGSAGVEVRWTLEGVPSGSTRVWVEADLEAASFFQPAATDVAELGTRQLQADLQVLKRHLEAGEEAG